MIEKTVGESDLNKELQVEYLPIEKVRPYANNAKLHPAEQIEEIKASIQLLCFRDPIGIWNGEIVEGHGRFIAAQELGMEKVPVIRMDDMTDEERRAYTLIHNKTTMDSDFEESLLELELYDIKDIDMSKFGFNLSEEVTDVSEVEEKQRRFEAMELKAFEHYDYLVFVFKNTMDWLNAVNTFGIKKVDAGYGKTKKIGIGRAVDGKRLLEKIRDTVADTEQREIADYNDKQDFARVGGDHRPGV